MWFGIGVAAGIVFTIIMFMVVSGIMNPKPKFYYKYEDDDRRKR